MDAIFGQERNIPKCLSAVLERFSVSYRLIYGVNLLNGMDGFARRHAALRGTTRRIRPPDLAKRVQEVQSPGLVESENCWQVRRDQARHMHLTFRLNYQQKNHPDPKVSCVAISNGFEGEFVMMCEREVGISVLAKCTIEVIAGCNWHQRIDRYLSARMLKNVMLVSNEDCPIW